MSQQSRTAVIVAAAGAALVIAGIVLGNRVDGLSLGTGLHALGVAALLAALALSFRSLWTFVRTDPRGKPVAGMLLLGFAVAAGWLFVRVQNELAAGRYWSEVEAAIASDAADAAPGLLGHLKKDELDDPRRLELKIRILKRLGELGDARGERALLDHWRSADEVGEVRRAAAESFAAVTKGVRVDRLIEELDDLERTGGGDDRELRPLVLLALRTATGESHEKHDDWLRWRLGTLLEEGTPDAVSRLFDRLGQVGDDVFRAFATTMRTKVSDPALRSTLEAVIRGKLAGRNRWSRRVLAIRIIGKIADPASIQPLTATFRKVVAEIAADRMKAPEGDRVSDRIGEALRAIAGTDLLAKDRWPPVYGFFVDLLGHDDEHVRNFAADGLEALTGQKLGLDRTAWRRWHEVATIDAQIGAGKLNVILADLRRRVAEKDIERSARNIRVLVRTGDAAAIRELRGIALRPSVETRIRTIAIDELTKAGKGLAKADLLALLEELDEAPDVDKKAVVQAIVRALVRFDEAAVVKALHDRMLIEEDATLRKTILQTLFGMFDDAVFAALVDAVGDEAPSLADEAAAELRKRTGKKFGVDPEAWQGWYDRTFKKE